MLGSSEPSRGDVWGRVVSTEGVRGEDEGRGSGKRRLKESRAGARVQEATVTAPAGLCRLGRAHVPTKSPAKERIRQTDVVWDHIACMA